jgi:hypothetical protein
MAVTVLAALSLAVPAASAEGLLVSVVIASTMLIVGMLCTAILGAVFRRGPDRAFWLGFAVFGWVFFALALVFTLAQHRLFAIVGSLPFAYIGGSVARRFAAAEGGRLESPGPPEADPLLHRIAKRGLGNSRPEESP